MLFVVDRRTVLLSARPGVQTIVIEPRPDEATCPPLLVVSLCPPSVSASPHVDVRCHSVALLAAAPSHAPFPVCNATRRVLTSPVVVSPVVVSPVVVSPVDVSPVVVSPVVVSPVVVSPVVVSPVDVSPVVVSPVVVSPVVVSPVVVSPVVVSPGPLATPVQLIPNTATDDVSTADLVSALTDPVSAVTEPVLTMTCAVSAVTGPVSAMTCPVSATTGHVTGPHPTVTPRIISPLLPPANDTVTPGMSPLLVAANASAPGPAGNPSSTVTQSSTENPSSLQCSTSDGEAAASAGTSDGEAAAAGDFGESRLVYLFPPGEEGEERRKGSWVLVGQRQGETRAVLSAENMSYSVQAVAGRRSPPLSRDHRYSIASKKPRPFRRVIWSNIHGGQRTSDESFPGRAAHEEAEESDDENATSDSDSCTEPEDAYDIEDEDETDDDQAQTVKPKTKPKQEYVSLRLLVVDRLF